MIKTERTADNQLSPALAKLGENIEISFTDDNTIQFVMSSEHKADNIFSPDIIQKIFAQLILRANGFFTKEMSLQLQNPANLHIVKEESFETKPISSWIIISGAFKGLFIFSYENKLAEYVLNRFITDQIGEDEYHELLQDMISEITNIISGGASDLIHDSMGNSILEVPVTVVDNKLKCLCDQAEFMSYHGLTNRGYFEITTMVSNT